MRISDWSSDVCSSDLRGVDAVEDRERNHRVAVGEPHPADTGRIAALEFANVVAGKADRLALPRREQHIVAFVEQRDADEAVVLVLALELHRDLAVRGHVGECVHAVTTPAALRGCEHDVQLATFGLVPGRPEEPTTELPSLMRN